MSYTVTTKPNRSQYDCSADFANTAFDKGFSYIIRKNGDNYEAVSGATGRLVYGGSDDEGGVDGSDDAAVIAAVLAAVSSGVVLLNGVAFDLTQFGDIPEDVRVICSYNAECWEYINSADSSGSPYTVSVGSGVNVGYYLAADSEGRICFTSTDCASLINSVLAEENVSVFVKRDTYSLTQRILMQNNTNLISDGAKLVSDGITAINVISTNNASNFSIVGFEIDANKETNNVITGYVGNNVLLSKLTLCNAKTDYGIYVRGVDADNLGDNIVINYCHITSVVKYGIMMQYLKNSEVHSNFIDSGTLPEIGYYGGICLYDHTYNVSVHDNHVSGGEYSILVYSDEVGHTISNNFVSKSYYGIYLDGDCNKVSGNTITDCTLGVRVYPYWDSNEILFNTIRDVTAGISVASSDSSSSFTQIIGNNIKSDGAGILLYTYISKNIVSENVIEAVGHGITVAWSDNIISNNIIVYDTAGAGNKYGINLVSNQGHDNLIEGNKIRTVSGGGYHIYCAFGALRNYIQNNDVYDSVGASPFIYASSTTTIVTGNKGFVTENSGSSTGTGSEQAIAHGLSYTPSYVWFSDKEDGANAYLSAASNSTHIHVKAVSGKDYIWKAETVPSFT